MKPTSIRRVKSADRTLDLLEAVAASPEPLTASDLSRALGIPKSSLFHLAGTMTERGYLTLDDHNRYRLGRKLAELGQAVEQPRDLVRLLDPVIASLSADLNESSSFNVEEGDQVRAVICHSGKQNLNYTMRVGDLAPLYAVSSGKVILAEKAPAELEAYLARVRFEQFTPNTIQSHERLWRDIERTRLEGTGFVDEEFTTGIVGLAAAVRRDGALVGAINLAVPKARIDPQSISRLRQRLRVAAAEATALLSAAPSA